MILGLAADIGMVFCIMRGQLGYVALYITNDHKWCIVHWFPGTILIEQIAQAKSVCYGYWYRILYYCCVYIPRSHTTTTAKHLMTKATTAETPTNAITHLSIISVEKRVRGAIRRIPTCAGSFVTFPGVVSVVWLYAIIERVVGDLNSCRTQTEKITEDRKHVIQ